MEVHSQRAKLLVDGSSLYLESLPTPSFRASESASYTLRCLHDQEWLKIANALDFWQI